MTSRFRTMAREAIAGLLQVHCRREPKRFSEVARCGWLLLRTVCLLVALQLNARGQVPPDGADDPQQRQIVQLIEAAERLMADGDWLQASDAFDAAWAEVYRGEDTLLSLNAGPTLQLQPGEHEVLAGVRVRLESVWQTAPDPFRRQYANQYEAIAEARLGEVLAAGQPDALQETVTRYQFTAAGRRAARALIDLHASRAEFLEAALQSGRVLRLSRDSEIRAAQQRELISYWWRAGLEEEAVDALRELLRAEESPTLQFGERQIPRPADETDLVAWISRSLNLARVDARPEWQQPLGNYRRTQLHSTGPAELSSAWSASTYLCEMNEDLQPLLQAVSEQLQQIAMRELSDGDSIASTAVPVAVGDVIVYRAAGNIHARDRRSGELLWESGMVDRELTGLTNRLRTAGPASDADHQRRAMLLAPQLFNHWQRANVGGQLTTDGRLVFAVEEVTSATLQIDPDSRPAPRNTQSVNYLRAYEVETGRLRGQAGGTLNGASGWPVNPLAGMYFLGAPLVMGDRIYILSESDQGIFLLQLRAKLRSGTGQGTPSGELDLRPVHSQLLSIPQFGLETHPVRKYSGIIPSFAQGLLICSTCDERVIAISAEDHSIRWVYRYVSNVGLPELGGGFPVIGNAINPRGSIVADQDSRWQDALPRIAGNRILVTPRDSDRLICLDLQSGQELWTRPRGSMRSLAAVSGDTVVLAGLHSVAGLRLTDGTSLWRTELDRATICGQAATNGHIVQLPTSAPAIESFDIRDGRHLLSQSLSRGGFPGNLLALDGELYSQSLREVHRLTQPQETESTPVLAAGQQLLRGRVADAADSLWNTLQDTQSALPENQRESARQLLIDTLLESLRLDYAGSVDQLPRVHQLIAESSPPKQQIASLVQTMLGMTPADAAILPAQWHRIDRTRRQLDWLQDAAAQGLLQRSDLPPDELAPHILRHLDDAFTSRDRDISTGTVVCRADRRAASAIRRVIREHNTTDPSDERHQQIVDVLAEPLQKRVTTAATSADAMWWCQICRQSGLVSAIAPLAIDDALNLPPEYAAQVTAQLLVTDIESAGRSRAEQSLAALLDLWLKHGAADSAQTLLDRSGADAYVQREPLTGAETPEILRRMTLYGNSVLEDVVSDWLQRHPEGTTAVPRPWDGAPIVTPSPARTAVAERDPRIGAVGRNVPLYGSAGAFPGWCFVQPVAENSLHALDSFGKLRWKFDPGTLFNDRTGRYARLYNNVADRYVLACGHLLAVKIQHMLFMLDCSTATPDAQPRVLWEMNLSTSLDELTPPQEFVPAWQRTDQYDIQPAGLFPVGPLTLNGLPLYSGRRLQVVEPLTGHRLWSVDGLPGDCSLTGNERELCLISEQSGQVEVRDMLDGRVARQVPIPEWWTDANENSNSSVADFEIEPGSDTFWRISVSGGRCLLFRLTSEYASLELFSLADNTTVWQTRLPADSVFSNPANGLVAVLSDGNRLRLFDCESGSAAADLEVPAARACRALYLRAGHGRLLVLTESVDDPSQEWNPVADAKPVHGWIYALNELDRTLLWTNSTDHEFIRLLNPELPAFPPALPVLCLLKRPYDKRPDGTDAATAHYSARVLDVRSGGELFAEEDLGRTLNFHSLRMDEAARQIFMGFELRTVTFDYSEPADGKPVDSR